MRSVSKFMAAAALAVLSASSFAVPVDWTGTLANVKITYYPDNSTNGQGIALLKLTGTGAPCKWVLTPGMMVLGGMTTNTNASVNATFAFLTQAKTANTPVTLTYDNSTSECVIMSVRR